MTKRPPLLAAFASAAFALACGVGWAGYAGYDSTFALIWGRELARGEAPSFDGPFAPTPHPLLNLVAAALSPLGAEAAAAAMEALAVAGLALLGFAAFRLGAALFGTWAGALCAVILVTRPAIVELALFAQFDVPALALVVLAAALVAEGGGRGGAGLAPLVPLALAGLLRPEAWILAAAYALWLRRPAGVALAAAAPLLWALHDLALTGDPLFSLGVTSDFADRAGDPTGLADAPDLLLGLTGAGVALGGVAGWLLVREGEQRRVALPAALFTLSVVPFLAYAALGLTLYARFLLPAAAALAVLAAAAATGWARAASPVVAVALAVSVPFTVADLVDVRRGSAERARLEGAIVELVRPYRACLPVGAPSHRVVAPLMHRLDLPGTSFTTRGTGALHIAVPSPRDHVIDPLSRDPVPPGARTAPPGARTLARTPDWILSSPTCGSPASP